jgi:CRISPR-associated endonuclease/helicase Cas3
MSRRTLWAKSPSPGQSQGEALTAHLVAALDAMIELQRRIGRIALLPERFWIWAQLAILLHDSGKVADGFQIMVGNDARPAEPWGERHEILSLGFIDRLLIELDPDDRLWVATGVASHHRAFTADTQAKLLPLFTCYQEEDPDAFAARFGRVESELVGELEEWLISTACAYHLLPCCPRLQVPARTLAEGAYYLFAELRDRWAEPLPRRDEHKGLTAVMLQAAVTLADHVSSAHGQLCIKSPLTAEYPKQLRARLDQSGAQLRAHQAQAAAVDGHLLLRAPTGSGKTEAALLWAQTQLHALHRSTGGNPRLFYSLPYLASINAMTDRLRVELDTIDIGVVHSRAASYHLSRALRDDCAVPDETADNDRVSAAHKAVSRTAATRLFRELVRVGTPYQLLRGALAGPAYSSILVDAVNSVFVFDELHAYEPADSA